MKRRAATDEQDRSNLPLSRDDRIASAAKLDAALLRFTCCGVQIAAADPALAVRVVLQSRHGVSRRFHLCNAYTLSLAVRNRDFRALLNSSNINLADGHYVAALGRRRGHPGMHTRVYGPDLMSATLDQGRARQLRHYLYGSSPETVAALAANITAQFPGVQLVGVESPPYRPLRRDEEVALASRVTAASPDIFWVGLGTPRQDHFVAAYTDMLGCTAIPVGAAFDFHAGSKPSAPLFFQRHGLEWLYRLANEPRRLWKRYLIGNPVFAYGALMDRWHA